jgi:hypothetical protein
MLSLEKLRKTYHRSPHFVVKMNTESSGKDVFIISIKSCLKIKKFSHDVTDL